MPLDPGRFGNYAHVVYKALAPYEHLVTGDLGYIESIPGPNHQHFAYSRLSREDMQIVGGPIRPSHKTTLGVIVERRHTHYYDRIDYISVVPVVDPLLRQHLLGAIREYVVYGSGQLGFIARGVYVDVSDLDRIDYVVEHILHGIALRMTSLSRGT